MMNKKIIAGGSTHGPIFSRLTGRELEAAVPIVHKKPDKAYIPQLVESAGAGWLVHLQSLLETLGKEKMGALLKVSHKSETAFLAACGNNKLLAMEFLYSTFDINIDEKCGNGVTPLFWAVAGQSKEAIGWLLDHGASKDIPSKSGRTPRDVAVERNLVEILNILDSY